MSALTTLLPNRRIYLIAILLITGGCAGGGSTGPQEAIQERSENTVAPEPLDTPATYRGALPFILSDFVRVAVLIAFPSITLCLVWFFG